VNRDVVHDGKGAFQVRFAFERRLVDRIKSLPNRRWNASDRHTPKELRRDEHDGAGEFLKKLRRITSNYTPPEDACISYQTLYQALEAFEDDPFDNRIVWARDAGDEEVVTCHHVRGRGRGSGVEVEFDYAYLWRLRGGKIVYGKAFRGPADALEAAGLSE